MKRPSKLHHLAVAGSLFFLIAPDAGMAAPIQGLGAQACASFASNFKKNPMMEAFYFTWAQGYMSGLNMGLLAIGNEMTDLSDFDIDRQQSFIRRFCDRHPLKNYSDAAVGLLTTIREKQGL